jgi:ubiquinone/menaquinone biosynthesis C-methylase UbiE
MHKLRKFLNPKWWRFEWRYWRHQTPWDTQITPPQVIAFIKRTQPGRALDLGCGTGTNAITLTQQGWQTVGVDFSPKAIATARKKSAKRNMKIDFHVGDVSNLSFLKGPFDYVLDIGCLFTLHSELQKNYVREIARLMPSGAEYMLYAWLPQQREGRQWGISAQSVDDLFGLSFDRTKMEIGKDGPGESAWYWYRRK